MPRHEDIDLDGLEIGDGVYTALQMMPNDEFKEEILGQEELFLKLAGDMPKELIFQRELLVSRL